MKKIFLLLLLTLFSLAHADTKYQFTSPSLSLLTGTVAPGTYYAAGARLTGWFSTSVPLQANLPFSNIRSLVNGWAFTDSVNTYTHLNSDPFLANGSFNFHVSTDANGHIDEFSIVLVQPKAVAIGDNIQFIGISSATHPVFTSHVLGIEGALCDATATGICTAITPLPPIDGIFSNTVGSWIRIISTPVSVFSSWMLILLTGLCLISITRLFKRKI